MKSNCYLEAWRAYASGGAVWMACRKSKWNKFGIFAAPVNWVGTGLLWTSTVIWLLGHFLRFGTWPHWIFCTDIIGDCKEYVPQEGKTKHAFPPMFFSGERRKFGDRRDCKTGGRRSTDISKE